MVSNTLRPHFTTGKDPVPIVQEVGWVPGPIWTGGKSRPHRDSIPNRPARSQSLYRLSFPAHPRKAYYHFKTICHMNFSFPSEIRHFHILQSNFFKTYLSIVLLPPERLSSSLLPARFLTKTLELLSSFQVCFVSRPAWSPSFTSIKTGCLFFFCIGLWSLITSPEFLHQVTHRSLHSRLSFEMLWNYVLSTQVLKARTRRDG